MKLLILVVYVLFGLIKVYTYGVENIVINGQPFDMKDIQESFKGGEKF